MRESSSVLKYLIFDPEPVLVVHLVGGVIVEVEAEGRLVEAARETKREVSAA
jgi:hypothetical protein